MSSPFGLSAALALPFQADGMIDLPKLVDHARWCLSSGCSSATVFGTTGEGPSLGMGERQQILGSLARSGIDMRQQVVAGVAASAAHAAAEQMRMLLDANCRAALVCPPYFFKAPSDEGIFNWFSAVFEAAGDDVRDVILYHIPSVTAVPLSSALIRRLRDAFPDVIVGIKDSSGDPDYARTVLAEHGDLIVLIGDERELVSGIKGGAQGSISGLANICPGELASMIEDRQASQRINKAVEDVLRYPVVPAVKALIARRFDDPDWARVRAPLVPLDLASAERMCHACAWMFEAEAT